jgi:hypothetical protein
VMFPQTATIRHFVPWTHSATTVMDDVRAAALHLQQRLKQKKCRKAIAVPVQTLLDVLDPDVRAPAVLLLACTEPFVQTDRIMSEAGIRENARKLKDVYANSVEAGANFAAAVFKFLASPSTRIGRIHGPRAESICCALLDGVLVSMVDAHILRSPLTCRLSGLS